LWVQDHLRHGAFQLFKVRGDENPADLCTKHLTRAVVDKLIEVCGIVRETGRAASAPRLNVEAEPLPSREPRGATSLAPQPSTGPHETTTDPTDPRVAHLHLNEPTTDYTDPRVAHTHRHETITDLHHDVNTFDRIAWL
jgi:hypothetical protein